MKLSLLIHDSSLVPNKPSTGQRVLITKHRYQELVREHGERAGLDEVVLVFVPVGELHNSCNNALACESPCKSPMVIVNLAYCEDLTEAALEAIIAHEIGHLARKDYMRSPWQIILTRACWAWGLSSLCSPSWRQEYRADTYALQAVGIEKMYAFYSEVLLAEHSSKSHPSGARRIARIQRAQAKIERIARQRQPRFALRARQRRVATP